MPTLLERAGGIIPGWPVPGNVYAAVTSRALPGRSLSPYHCANLASHVGDDRVAVAYNREALRAWVTLPSAPTWLEQVHGIEVAELSALAPNVPPRADAAYSCTPGVPCAVLTADCLPILLASAAGDEVAAVHAGWRGLADGVIERSVQRFRAAPQALHAWLGPAISQAAFEIGPEVQTALLAADPQASSAFRRGRGDRWYADLYALARSRLAALGVVSVSGGGLCTVAEAGRFYSHRRDGTQSGRFATLIWLA